MACSATRNLRRACFWNLNLSQHNAQQYILNYHQKGGCNVSFIWKNIKKQNAYPCKFQKKNKSAAVSLSQMCSSKLVESRNY